jgi:hypothetical protein
VTLTWAKFHRRRGVGLSEGTGQGVAATHGCESAHFAEWGERIVSLLQNTAIERPEKVFDVELIVFGTLTQSAVKRTIKVLAQTGSGAKRICKSRYRRIEIKSAREAGAALTHPVPDLFSAQPA